MRINKWLGHGLSIAALGAMVFLSVPSVAAVRSHAVAQPPQACVPSPTQGTGELLSHVWRDAQQVARRADSLENLANYPNEDRGIQAWQLRNIRAKAGDMEKQLCQLEGIRESVPPGQLQAVREATRLVEFIANQTNNAMDDRNAHIAYGGYTQMIRAEARTIAREVGAGQRGADRKQENAR